MAMLHTSTLTQSTTPLEIWRFRFADGSEAIFDHRYHWVVGAYHRGAEVACHKWPCNAERFIDRLERNGYV